VEMLENVKKALRLCCYEPDPYDDDQPCKMVVSCDICPYWDEECGCRETDLFNDTLKLLDRLDEVSMKCEERKNDADGHEGNEPQRAVPELHRIIELLQIERECVSRNHDQSCDRICGACDLAQEDQELLSVYDGAINYLKALRQKDEEIRSLQKTIAELCDGIAQTAPRVLSIADIIDNLVTPTVIWFESRNANVFAGVWQIDHYEMEDGSILTDLGMEIAEAPGAYNVLWRVWTDNPNDACRNAHPWQNHEHEQGGNRSDDLGQ